MDRFGVPDAKKRPLKELVQGKYGRRRAVPTDPTLTCSPIGAWFGTGGPCLHPLHGMQPLRVPGRFICCSHRPFLPSFRHWSSPSAALGAGMASARPVRRRRRYRPSRQPGSPWCKPSTKATNRTEIRSVAGAAGQPCRHPRSRFPLRAQPTRWRLSNPSKPKVRRAGDERTLQPGPR